MESVKSYLIGLSILIGLEIVYRITRYFKNKLAGTSKTANTVMNIRAILNHIRDGAKAFLTAAEDELTKYLPEVTKVGNTLLKLLKNPVVDISLSLATHGVSSEYLPIIEAGLDKALAAVIPAEALINPALTTDDKLRIFINWLKTQTPAMQNKSVFALISALTSILDNKTLSESSIDTILQSYLSSQK